MPMAGRQIFKNRLFLRSRLAQPASFVPCSAAVSFPVSSCWYFYCKFEEGRLEREEEVEAKGMMVRKGRREETGEDCSLQPCISVLQRCSAIFGVFSILSFRLTY